MNQATHTLPERLPDFLVTKVAAQATCSRETVRRVLREPERTQPATRARVVRAMTELGLLGEPAAREG